jgi:uncharacterized protein YaeQ
VRNLEVDCLDMALKATVYKARLSLSNLNIHHYSDYSITLAKHPSETDQRLMFRLMAFSLLAHEDLQFTKGLSDDDEPDLWKINHDGSIDHWIELGVPDERRIRQICGKAKQVSIYTYHGEHALHWFDSIEKKLHRFGHLNVVHFIPKEGMSLEDFASKSMNLSITIEDNEIWLSCGEDRICVEFKIVKSVDFDHQC